MSPTSALTASMLMMLGCASRLWNLHLPSTPVYDETHVGRFLNWYHERRFFFDVHPPLAKLLMYWTATALGFDGRASCPYDDPSPYVSPCSLAPQRLVPALCGACMVPLTYATCCAMELHPLAALLCSWLVLVDPLWIGLSRIHLNDMVQMLFIALTHLLALYACAPPLPNTAREQPPSHLQSIGLLVGTGVCLGCALQCKFAMALTTVAWLGLQNLITLGHLAVEAQGVSTLLSAAVLRGSLLLGIPVAIHLGLFAVHLSYLPNTGNGDGYLSETFQSSLIGNPHELPPDAPRPAFLSLASEHFRAQFWYNRNMAILFPRGSHPFDTPWYSWPFAWRGIYFNLVRDWAAAAATIGQPQTFGFFLHPNPYVSIGTAGGVALAASLLTWRLLTVCAAGIAACVSRARQPPHNAATATRKLAHLVRPGGAGSLVLAQLLHWLPYVTQARQTFLIYYLPAYYFSILLLARGWHAFVCVPLRLPVAVLSTVGVAAAVGASSWQLAPIAYGSEVRLDQWTAALRLASTECWGGATCWVE